MKNTNEILERILLNMKYDSKKTLSENNESLIKKKLMYDILTETTTDPPRKKVPSVSVDLAGYRIGQGQVVRDITFPKNPSKYGLSKKDLVITKDYHNKQLKFYGQVNETIKEHFKPLLDIITQNQYAYRDSSANVWVPKSGDYYKLTGKDPGWITDMNYNRVRDKKQWILKPLAWNYTDDTIGKMAQKCKDYYQDNYRDQFHERDLNYQFRSWYHEPKDISSCVKKSLENILNNGNSNAPYKFTPFNENLYGYADEFMGIAPHSGYEVYTAQIFCQKYDRGGSRIEGPCMNGVKFTGYKSEWGYWFTNDNDSDKISNYTSTDICKWLNNPNSKYYYKNGWNYDRLVDEGIIADTPNNQKTFANCIPVNADQYLSNDKKSHPSLDLPDDSNISDSKKTNSKTSTITLTFKGGG